MNEAGSVRGRRGVKGVVLLLAVAVLVGLIVFFTDDASDSSRPLDPQGWRKSGGHALAALLSEQGVNVRVVRTVAEAKAAVASDTLLLVTNSDFLSGEESLRQVAALPGDRVVLGSSYNYAQVQALAPGSEYHSGYKEQKPREPGCSWSGAQRAGELELGGQAFRAPDIVDSCYDGIVLRYRQGGRMIAILGDSSFLSNAGIAAPGASALALNLLGARPTVVWLAPEVPQTDGAKVGQSLMSLVPDQIWWAARTLAAAVVLTALWQARRLGPVVVERLPVVVRASETAEGLGKLYQARRARDRAAAALRTAALGRLSKRLAIPARAQDTMAAVLAARSNRSPEEIKSVLYGLDPATDSDLVALAQRLDELELDILEHGV